ncbi:MAG: penicillin-binding transpeptidase domain-containing protein [Eubacteriales bacterium]|nr:penicillin-binding transpeptidase domain-containing protein [Eubacteriales bacterium]
MKRISNRAVSVLFLAFLVICGMIVYVIRYVDDGAKWAMYFSRINSGSTGELTDRNGIRLAFFSGSENSFSEDDFTRRANYHVTGDYWGRTGTGVLSRFSGELQGFDPISGTTQVENSRLKLNIDSRLNNIIYKQLFQLTKNGEDRYSLDENGNDVIIRAERYNAAVLVCNYRTGELLGMVSMPTVDPLDADTVPQEGAYINRCLSAAFVPGSVFKLVTAIAAIENLPDLDSRSYYCEKTYDIAGVPIVCSGVHYTQNFAQALANSCNVAFSQIAVSLGQDTMVKYVKELGLLDRHELDGIPTAKGSYPTEFVGDPELGWSGIGQSTDLVCPYSLLRIVSAIANDGVIVEPKLIMDGKKAESSRLLERTTAEKMKELMAFNVSYHYGGDATFPGLNICAKTGTAETGYGTTHSWFAGFLNDDAHPYAFVTFVEDGGDGLGTAGVLTNRILQYYLKELSE